MEATLRMAAGILVLHATSYANGRPIKRKKAFMGLSHIGGCRPHGGGCYFSLRFCMCAYLSFFCFARTSTSTPSGYL